MLYNGGKSPCSGSKPNAEDATSRIESKTQTREQYRKVCTYQLFKTARLRKVKDNMYTTKDREEAQCGRQVREALLYLGCASILVG